MSKPSFKWPLICLAFSVYVFGAAFVDAFIDTEEDQLYALFAVPISFGCIVVCLVVISKWIDKLDEWKEQQRLDFILKTELPRPQATDWERFERDVERALNPPPPDRRNPFARSRRQNTVEEFAARVTEYDAG